MRTLNDRSPTVVLLRAGQFALAALLSVVTLIAFVLGATATIVNALFVAARTALRPSRGHQTHTMPPPRPRVSAPSPARPHGRVLTPRPH